MLRVRVLGVAKLKAPEPSMTEGSANSVVLVDVACVILFATVPYPQLYYDAGGLDEESFGMGKVADYGS